MILSHVNCFVQGEFNGFQVLQDSLHPRSTRAVFSSSLRGEAVKIFLASVSSGIRGQTGRDAVLGHYPKGLLACFTVEIMLYTCMIGISMAVSWVTASLDIVCKVFSCSFSFSLFSLQSSQNSCPFSNLNASFRTNSWFNSLMYIMYFLHSHSYSFRTDFKDLNLYWIKGALLCLF